MRILVTGPRGFVGARVMDELGRDAIPAPSLRAVDEDGIKRMVDEAQPELIDRPHGGHVGYSHLRE